MYLLQARDSVTANMHVWTSASADDSDYPGPNAAQEIAILRRPPVGSVGSAATTSFDDTGLTYVTGANVQAALESTDAAIDGLDLETVLTTGANAGGLAITNLGAVTSTNAEANGGSPTVSLAPDDTAQISGLTTASNTNYDFAIGTDGVYRGGVTVTVKMATAGTYLTADFAVHFRRASSTVTLVGTAIQGSAGDDTGITVTISGSSSNLRVNVANATGETVSGYVHYGAVRSSLIA